MIALNSVEKRVLDELHKYDFLSVASLHAAASSSLSDFHSGMIRLVALGAIEGCRDTEDDKRVFRVTEKGRDFYAICYE